MIPLRKFISISLLLLTAFSGSFAQDLFDREHSGKFADYLYKSQQFELAAMEFERLSFLDPGNINYRYLLLQSYRKSDQTETGIKRILDWYPVTITDTTIFREYTKLNLLEGNYQKAQNALSDQQVLDPNESGYYHLASLMLQRDWTGADNFLSRTNMSWPGFEELGSLSRQRQEINYRNPGLAVALSAFVPGLGKVYSHDWKDGILSLAFVATNAYQSYRGFSKNGINSAYGWIFGSLSLGFYAGNLFGSWKSAKNFNLRSENQIYNEIQNSVFGRF